MNNRQLFNRLKSIKPTTRQELHTYIHTFLNLRIPSKSICENHSAPLDYLAHAFNIDNTTEQDCIVWANRGGGKTQLGAVASLMESIFHPNCQTRILGGSEEQSQRMFEGLQKAIDSQFTDHIKGRVTAKACRFKNGSNVQSEAITSSGYAATK